MEDMKTSEATPAKDLPACPAETTLMLIGDKWNVLIVRDLMPGSKRFGELKKSIGHISPKVSIVNLWRYFHQLIVEKSWRYLAYTEANWMHKRVSYKTAPFASYFFTNHYYFPKIPNAQIK